MPRGDRAYLQSALTCTPALVYSSFECSDSQTAVSPLIGILLQSSASRLSGKCCFPRFSWDLNSSLRDGFRHFRFREAKNDWPDFTEQVRHSHCPRPHFRMIGFRYTFYLWLFRWLPREGVHGIKQRRRPPKHWIDSIKEDCGMLGMTITQTSWTARDRNNCGTAINGLPMRA